MKISLFKGIFLGAFGLAAMVGLFVFATHTSKSTSATNGVGKVVIWGTLSRSSMQTALTTIAQTEQSLKEVSYVQKDPTTLPSDLASAIAVGNGPDLVLASQEELHSLTKFIAPISVTMLPASTFTSTFIREAGLLGMPDGAGYYGLPFLLDPLVLFSNRALLSSNGIAKPPVSWEALTGLVPSITKLTPTKQITRGLIALGTYDNIHNARAILSSLFLQTGVPISTYGNGGLVGRLSGVSSDVGSPGQAVLSFYTQFADPSKVSYTWNASLEDSRQSFTKGDLALYLGYASESRILSATNPNLDFVVTTLPQPATAVAKSAYGLLYSLSIPRGAQNPSGAYQAAALLTNSTEQAVAAGVANLTPVILSQLATLPSDPIKAIAYAEALYANGWLSPLPSLTDSLFSSMISGVITGRSDINTTLTSGENSLSSLLQK